MAIEDLIVDPTLLPLLQTSRETLSQTLSILTWLAENNNADSPSQPDVDTRLEFSSHQKKLLAHLAQLRGQNRRAAFEARATKQDTANARQEVDRLLLQLQNLYYEQRHLMGEIGACEGYDHLYTHLPLLSLDEFISLFPDRASLPEQELMPLRIEHEKEEREKMEAQRLELVNAKEALAKENARKKEELRRMDEKIEGAVESFKVIEEGLTKDL